MEDPFVAALLRAGREELPPRGAEHRALAKAARTTAPALGAWKWLVVAGTAGLTVLAGSVATSRGGFAERPASASPEVDRARVGRLESSPPIASIAPLPSASARPRAAAPPPRESELALLESVRTFVRGGEGARALSRLDEHARRFPRGRFLAEAAVLRIEATALAGDAARAGEEARRFLLEHPESPYAKRVAAFTGYEAPFRSRGVGR